MSQFRTLEDGGNARLIYMDSFCAGYKLSYPPCLTFIFCLSKQLRTGDKTFVCLSEYQFKLINFATFLSLTEKKADSSMQSELLFTFENKLEQVKHKRTHPLILGKEKV